MSVCACVFVCLLVYRVPGVFSDKFCISKEKFYASRESIMPARKKNMRKKNFSFLFGKSKTKKRFFFIFYWLNFTRMRYDRDMRCVGFKQRGNLIVVASDVVSLMLQLMFILVDPSGRSAHNSTI